VVLACGADTEARGAVGAVRLELVDRDRWLLWAPYETLLAAVDGEERWKSDVSARYLDVTPVAGHLAAVDPRLGAPTPPVDVDGLSVLGMIGPRVTGDGSVLDQIVAADRLAALAESGDPDLQALVERAAALAEDLRALRESASPTHDQIC
jgi:hypothetical protein